MTWEWRIAAALKRQRTEIDLRNVAFMEPWALVMFAAFALRLRSEKRDVAVLLDPANDSNRYIDAMGLRYVIEHLTSTPNWDQSARNTGLHVLKSHADVTRFIDSAATLGPGLADELTDALKYGMAELGRNVIQHAMSPFGGVAIAQYFPEMKAVQIAICDCGQGVLQSLHANYPELRSNLEAVKLALLPHASGAPAAGPYGSSENAGLGLFFCKEICWRTGGSFWLVSRDALVGVRGDDLGGQGRLYRRVNPWEGTLVTMHLPEQKGIEFDEILSRCRELAREARTKSGAAGAVDFIDNDAEIDCDERVVIDFLEDVQRAAQIRDTLLMPAVTNGKFVVLDFAGARFVTQSFAHALLHDVFKISGSLTRLAFTNCSKGTQEAIRLVAAYSANYRQQEL